MTVYNSAHVLITRYGAVDSRGFGDYSLENKVIKLLRTRGHQADIVGERDSFGWVTRGIEVDGVIMAII